MGLIEMAAQIVTGADEDREKIRQMLDDRYNGVIPVTDEMIDAVMRALREDA